MDDDDEWQEMPVLRTDREQTKIELEKQYKEAREMNGEYSDDDNDNDTQDSKTKKKKKKKGHLDSDSSSDDGLERGSSNGLRTGSKSKIASTKKPRRPKEIKRIASHAGYSVDPLGSPSTAKTPTGNATGDLIDFDTGDGTEWRAKEKGMDEQDYTRLELDEDPEEDEVHTRTQYLFDDDKGMTPLSQMQTTKQMLTEGQRIAYVGLCRLVMREMAVKWKAVKELEPAVESLNNWSTKIMGRLYQHMEVEPAEQRMIELLAEHGVTAMDLVPSLVTTHTVPNPEYDPEAEREAQEEAEEEAREAEATKVQVRETQAAQEPGEAEDTKASEADDERLADYAQTLSLDELNTPRPERQRTVSQKSLEPPPPDYTEADQGDLGQLSTPTGSITPLPEVKPNHEINEPSSPTSPAVVKSTLVEPLPSSLPGVSTTLTSADRTVTLDIRWTILCDLFLALVADSVYDARSRVLLGRIADQLGLTWMDVVRFERRLTEALEIQEGVAKRENSEVLVSREKADKTKRYVMMGLATLGGGLVLGLSAGLLAPAIGAGIAGALTTVGVSGGTAFLGSAGGAAVITTGGVLTGSHIGGRGMARRTKAIAKFEFQPLHNNKRLNAYITVPGFMNGPEDDVRLPFSVMDPIMGDVFSVLWEPQTLGQTGNALKILTSEVLSSVGQQVLQATLLSAMMTAMQWPILLTKLGYLIDNPWSNALDRARQAGEVLAQILIHRHMGVRPISLIGFSLGARVVFYTLVALAKQKAFGVVQDVYLMGATVTASRKTWREIRGVVSGRFVNAYARNDWVLGYLFRATTGGLNTVAGLRPVEFVPELENVDITERLTGHMSYRTLMPLILKELGFRVTADSFDEPEDLNAPDREIINPEQELARLEAQKKASWLARFKKDKSGDSSRRGSAVSTASAGSSKTGAVASKDDPGKAGQVEEEDLPPRLPGSESHANNGDLGSAQSGMASTSASAGSEATPQSARGSTDTAGVGFDLSKIRAEIAEDDGSGQLPGRSSSSQSVSTASQASTTTTAAAGRSSIDSPTSSNFRSPTTSLASAAEILRTPSAPPVRPLLNNGLGRSDTAPLPPTVAGAERAQLELERQEEIYEQELRDRLKVEALEMAKEAEREEKEEEERRRRKGGEKQTMTEAASYPSYMQNNPFAATSTASFSNFDPPSSSSNSRQQNSSNSSNPFSFTFPFANGHDPNASVLSFGGDDGSISSFSAGGDVGSSPWSTSNASTSTVNGGNNNAWRDPWSSGNEWR